MKNMTYISDLLGGGSMTTNIPGLHACSIDVDNADNDELVFKQQQSTYGRRMRIHDGQFGMNIVNSLLIAVMGLKACASRLVLCVWDTFIFM